MSKDGFYDQLVNAIIRPERKRYEDYELGEPLFVHAGHTFVRKDMDVLNERNMKIKVSHYMPHETERPKPVLPCVIFLHGNAGNRLNAIADLPMLLVQGITCVTLDFTGSGNADGEYVSLGWYEKDDLKAVVNYLRASGTVSRIGLWGRSMGAATAILYAHTDPSIAGMVLDSPYASLSQLSKELVESQQLRVPGLMVSIGMKLMRSTIKKKANFDIDKLEPIDYVGSCFVPALFVHGKEDDFIQPHHSQLLYNKYAGDKNLVLVEGDHNSSRPEFFQDSASIFFNNTLLVGEDSTLAEQMATTKGKGAAAARAAGAITRPPSMPQSPIRGPGGLFPGTTDDFDSDEDAELAAVLALSLQEAQHKQGGNGGNGANGGGGNGLVAPPAAPSSAAAGTSKPPPPAAAAAGTAKK